MESSAKSKFAMEMVLLMNEFVYIFTTNYVNWAVYFLLFQVDFSQKMYVWADTLLWNIRSWRNMDDFSRLFDPYIFSWVKLSKFSSIPQVFALKTRIY